MHTGFWWGNLRKNDNLEDLGINWRIILKRIKKWEGGIDWIDMAQDRDWLRTLANAVIFHKMWRVS